MDPFEKSVRDALLADTRDQNELARLIGCTQGFISHVKSGKRGIGKLRLQFCKVLNLDPATGEPLGQKPEPKPEPYDWLRQIDLRQLGIRPPTRPPPKGKAKGAMFIEEQAPFTLTDTQVQVIVAMIERRYIDAIGIVTEVLQGKREH